MPSTYSPSLKIELIGNGEQTGSWGDTTNNNLGTLIEQAIAGVGAITLTGDTVLTNYNGLTDQSRNAVLVFSGALANSANVTAPSVEKTYVVVNNSGANVTLKTTGGTGITLQNNTSQLLYCNGSEFYTALNVNTVTGDMTVTGNEAVVGTFSVGGQVTFNGNLSSLTNSLSFTSYTGIIDASANTGALVAPTGTTAQRPASPELGTARWNTTLGWYEIWNGSTWVSITGTYAISYLLVGGGGGGGYTQFGIGGGGGAGGFSTGTTTVTAGTNYAITVGAGGNAGDGLYPGLGNNGANTTAFSLTAIGGGGGGGGLSGLSGGSGGGGPAAGGTTGGSGTSGQGNAGGNGDADDTGPTGGGGGGAIAVGGTAPGVGGAGNSSSISGTLTYYAGGGGGAGGIVGGTARPGGAGGVGGGGKGEGNNGASVAGTANTGGGGGAGSKGNDSATGGKNGGSGVVIVSYTASYQRGSGGTVTSYSSGGNTYYVHTFTTSGTFTA